MSQALPLGACIGAPRDSAGSRPLRRGSVDDGGNGGGDGDDWAVAATAAVAMAMARLRLAAAAVDKDEDDEVVSFPKEEADEAEEDRLPEAEGREMEERDLSL